MVVLCRMSSALYLLNELPLSCICACLHQALKYLLQVLDYFFLLFLRRLLSPFFFNKIFFFVLTNPKLQGLDPSSLGAPDFDRKGKERNVGIYVLATRWRMNRVAPYPPFSSSVVSKM